MAHSVRTYSRRPQPVVRWDLRDVERQFDRLVQSAFAPVAGPGGAEPRTWRPVADVTESDSGYVISLELPGFRRDEIEVGVEGDTLTVSGEYARPEEGAEPELRHARRSGRFVYRAQLPQDVAADGIGAALADGVLRVSVPKTEQPQPRTIEITEG